METRRVLDWHARYMQQVPRSSQGTKFKFCGSF